MGTPTEPSTQTSEAKPQEVSFADLPSQKLSVTRVSYRGEEIWKPSDGELKPDEVTKRMQSVRELKAKTPRSTPKLLALAPPGPPRSRRTPPSR